MGILLWLIRIGVGILVRSHAGRLHVLLIFRAQDFTTDAFRDGSERTITLNPAVNRQR